MQRSKKTWPVARGEINQEQQTQRAKGTELAGERTKKRCDIYTPYIQQREKHKHDEKNEIFNKYCWNKDIHVYLIPKLTTMNYRYELNHKTSKI